MASCRVTFEPVHRTVTVDPDQAPFEGTGRPGSILDIALANGISIEHACGGTGACGTCYVLIEQGMENLSEPDDDEADTLETSTDNAPNGRLACQAVVRGDVTVRIP